MQEKLEQSYFTALQKFYGTAPTQKPRPQILFSYTYPLITARGNHCIRVELFVAIKTHLELSNKDEKDSLRSETLAPKVDSIA